MNSALVIPSQKPGMTAADEFGKACTRAFSKMIRHGRRLAPRLLAKDPAAFVELGGICGGAGAKAGLSPVEVTYWSARVLTQVLQEHRA